MSKLNIKYSAQIELDRVMGSIKKLPWFRENNYLISLPEGISELSSEEKIKEVVEKEYSENILVYEKEKDSLLERWEEHSKILEKKLKECSLIFHPEYEVFFSAYGVGGSYQLPNLLIVNAKKGYQIGLLRTVIHEIIHLAIEEDIQKYGIEHWAKERIVDLTFEKFFPELVKKQNILIPTEKIDNIFTEHYPNMEETLSLLSKDNQKYS